MQNQIPNQHSNTHNKLVASLYLYSLLISKIHRDIYLFTNFSLSLSIIYVLDNYDDYDYDD